MNCPFYGVAFMPFHKQLGDMGVFEPHFAPFFLMSTNGNQCALVVDAHSPCYLEVHEQREPDWATCPRVSAVRGGAQ